MDESTASLADLGAVEAAALIAAGEVSSVELTTACLDRIDERDVDVRAWVRAPAEVALAQARDRDATEPTGPLHGVPFGVKDLVDTADLATEYGSSIHAGHRPGGDAACVRRLVDAGGVVLGKTVTTEFAFFHPGPTANPHDVAHTPGGSSSGSAAAVADHHVPLAIGTQTAGSIVRPASFCGVWGGKPTFGAVPTAGVKPAGPSLDTIGLFARAVEDLVVGLSVLGGEPDARAGSTPRLGFARTHEWDDLEEATRDAVAALADDLGCPRVDLPASFAGLVGAQSTIMDVEARASLAEEHDRHRDELSQQLRAALDRAEGIDPARVEEARALATRCRSELDEAFGEFDALLVPAVLGEAPAGLGSTGDPLPCRAWTLLGTPAVAVPGLVGPGGLPLGVQVVARPGADASALAAAAVVGRHLGPPPRPTRWTAVPAQGDDATDEPSRPGAPA